MLKPNMRMIYKVDGRGLLVEPVPSLEEVFEEPQPVELTLEEFHEFRRKLSREFET